MLYSIERDGKNYELTHYELRLAYLAYRNWCMHEDVRGLIGYDSSIPEEEFTEHGYTKEELLKNDAIIDDIVAVYQHYQENSEEWYDNAKGAIQSWLYDNRRPDKKE